MAPVHVRQSRPDYGPGSQVKVLETFILFPLHFDSGIISDLVNAGAEHPLPRPADFLARHTPVGHELRGSGDQLRAKTGRWRRREGGTGVLHS